MQVCEIEIGTVIEERPNRFGMPQARGVVQCRQTLLVLGMNAGAMREQRPDLGNVPVPRRPQQRTIQQGKTSHRIFRKTGGLTASRHVCAGIEKSRFHYVIDVAVPNGRLRVGDGFGSPKTERSPMTRSRRGRPVGDTGCRKVLYLNQSS